MFDALPADHPAVVAEMKTLREKLWVKTPVGGMARYTRDYYHQIERNDIDKVPGNPWIICTLWLAMHRIASATNLVELEQAVDYMEWTRERAAPSGVLAEQYHPYTGDPVSVSPLTWSHATVMTVAIKYLLKHAELTGKRSGAMAELVLPDAE
jgi:GH15 family glucan-1,4-alpha-glucosidase